VATLRPDGRAAHLVSYLGSSSHDSAFDVAAVGAGSVRVTGVTSAASFTGGSVDPSGTSNAFVIVLDGLRMPGGEPAVEQRDVRYGYDGLDDSRRRRRRPVGAIVTLTMGWATAAACG
jgi:hypothetical protein